MEYKSLGSLVKFVGGYSFKSEKYVPSGLRVIRITNVQDGILEDNAPCYYPIEYKDMIGNALLKEGDLLMSLTGNVGRVAFITDEFLPAGLNQRVECFRTDDNIIKKYLFYMFKSKTFIQEALKNATGVAQLNMSTTWLKDYMVPIRNSNEMNSIIKTLESIESAILSEKNAILSYDSLIKSRFNEMFKNITTIKTIGEFCTLKSGMTFPKEYELSSGDILYCKVSDMNLEGNEKYLITSKTYVEKSVVKKALIPKGSICFPKRGAAIGTNKKRLVIKDTCVDLNVMAVTPNELVRPEYLFYVFLNIDLLSLCDGSIIPQLNNIDINPIKVKIPSIDLQDKFIAIVHHIDKLKFINKNKF